MFSVSWLERERLMSSANLCFFGSQLILLVIHLVYGYSASTVDDTQGVTDHAIKLVQTQ